MLQHLRPFLHSPSYSVALEGEHTALLLLSPFVHCRLTTTSITASAHISELPLLMDWDERKVFQAATPQESRLMGQMLDLAPGRCFML